MDKIDKILLQQVADLHKIPSGAFSIRKNGQIFSRNSTKEIEIVQKEDGSGINIKIAPNTKGKSVHIPVIVTIGNFSDTVCNDFYIGENGKKLLTLAGMVIADEEALICDFAETYGIYDYRKLPLKTAAILASGLRDNSRIKIKMSGLHAAPDTITMAACSSAMPRFLRNRRLCLLHFQAQG